MAWSHKSEKRTRRKLKRKGVNKICIADGECDSLKRKKRQEKRVKEINELERLFWLNWRVGFGLLGERKEHWDRPWQQGVGCGEGAGGVSRGGGHVDRERGFQKDLLWFMSPFWNFQR